MDHRKPGPAAGGSARAKAMLAAAQAGGGKAGQTPRRQPGSDGPPMLTFSRTQRQKRESEEGGLAGSMQCTPKKQCLPAAGGPRPLAALRPSSASLPATQSGAVRDATCTRVIRASADKAYFLGRRQEYLEAEERRRYGSGSGGGLGAIARLPAGMRNLGNTCYLNAVLQVLLSLPAFTADLRHGRAALESGGGGPLSSSGIYSALLECLAAKEGSRYITPASLKRALDARSAAFQGAFQQDAHELFCGLLDLLQSEVLAREVRRLGRPQVRISETADPAARNFSFAVQHELECSGCGRTSRVVEEYMHLSLELPEPQPGSCAPETSVAALLREYFKEEEVEKSCEGCGGANLPHRLRHTIRRLPRVLVLHMKRFKVAWSAEQQQPVCQKLHTRVEMPEAVRLESFLADAGALPPLPGGAAAEPGKENERQAANADLGSPRAAIAGTQREQPTRPLGGMQPRAGGSFYGGCSGSAAAASSGLLSPVGVQAATPFLKRRGTPAAFKGASALADEHDAELQQALALSMLESHPGQRREQQGAAPPPPGQRQQGEQGAAPEVLLVRAHGPYSSAAAEVFLPADVEAAAQQAGQPSAGSPGGGGGLGQQWFMGMGRQSGDRRSSGGAGVGGMGKTAAQREAEELARVMELSRREYERQQAAGSGAAANGGLVALSSAAAQAAAAEGDAHEDAELQRALELSRLEAGLEAGQFPVLGSSPAAAGERQQQQAGGGGSAFDLILQDSPQATPTGAASQAAAGRGEAAAAAVGDEAVAGGGAAAQAAGGAAAAAAPAYCHAQIVEDDALPAAGAAGAADSEGAGARPGPDAAADVPAVAAAAAAEAAAAAKRVQYRLHASVAHQGPAASCGHFTADVCDPTTRAWHRLDDSVAARISGGEARSAARQREAYLLFYVAGG